MVEENSANNRTWKQRRKRWLVAVTLAAVLASVSASLTKFLMKGESLYIASPSVSHESSIPTKPQFPCPPPRASAMQVLPTVFLRDQVTLGDVKDTLRAILGRAGKHELRFYTLDGALCRGFAIVTKLESIDRQGNSRAGMNRRVTRDFVAYIRNLFWVPPGYYRMVVFVVSDHFFEASGETLDRATAESFLSRGFADLPEREGSQLYTEIHRTTALIYEFRKDEQDEVAQLISPGQFSAQYHLQKIGWYAAAEQMPKIADVPLIFTESPASGNR